MEATAGAASTPGAGTGSAQSGSTSSQSKTSNPASQNSPSQRQVTGAAPPSSPVDHKQPAADTGRDESGRFASKQPAADEDPEFDFGEGRKFKRSQVLSDIQRIRQEQSATAKRYAEAQKRAEAAEAYAQHLKSLGIDPERFAKDPQSAIREYTHDYVRRQIEEAQMDPRELEFKRREETLAEREQRIQAEEHQRQQAEHTARVTARADEFASEMHDALAASNLPRNPQTVARMATLMLAAARNGVQIPKAELAARVAQQVAAEQEFYDSQISDTETATRRLQPMLSRFEGDAAALAKALGQKHMDGLRKHILQEAQSKFSPQPQTQPRQRAVKLPDIPNRSHHTYHTLDELREWEKSGAKGGARR